MDRRSSGLAAVLVLAFGFLGCQDQGALAPDDMDPLFKVNCRKTPDDPECTDPDAIMVRFTAGFNLDELGQPWDWMEWDPGHDPGLLLELSSQNLFETDLEATYSSIDLDATPANGDYAPCSYEPSDADPVVIEALARQLDGIAVPADTEEEEHIQNTKISVEQEETSLENFVRFLYISTDDDLRLWDKRRKDYVDAPIGLQVGGQFNDWGDTQVTVEEGDDFDTFTFIGGTVSVAHRGGKEIRLQCPLDVEDVVVVQVKGN